MAKHTISNTDDVIDSRDVIERIRELEELGDEAADGDGEELQAVDGKMVKTSDEFGLDEYNELLALKSLAEEASSSPDWKYGETLIRDSHFNKYAQQLAEDIGAYNPNEAKWPLTCIDWEQAANELSNDYFTVDFDGVTYYIRS